ncbi:GGDEF domain-containing protein [Clostridiaceae bacterium HSG29]|nr:GGDEF domain-containing protein [Clostridiaceae bacterium HSG29]
MIKKRMFKLVISGILVLSFVNIIGNYFVGLPFSMDIKWIILIILNLIILKSKNLEKISFYYFLFIIIVVLPYGWYNSGCGVNSIIGYVFLLMIFSTYLFIDIKRNFLIIALISVFIILFYLEYNFPEIMKSYDQSAIFLDRVIHVPINLIASYYFIRQFEKSFRVEKQKVERISLELEKANFELNKHVNFDNLTNISNRRFFDVEFKKIFTVKKEEIIFIVLIDIDNLKKVNDEYGHLKGDSLIIEFSSIAITQFPRPHIFSRWGGDEFGLIFFGEYNELIDKINKIRNEFSKSDLDIEINKTISVGITEFIYGMSKNELLLKADKALYRSKTEGKNGITFIS